MVGASLAEAETRRKKKEEELHHDGTSKSNWVFEKEDVLALVLVFLQQMKL